MSSTHPEGEVFRERDGEPVTVPAADSAVEAGQGSLASDPMAEYVVPGTSLPYENTLEGGTVLGKPVEAQVVRRFDLNGIGGREAVEQAGEAAAGYEGEPALFSI